VSWGVIADLATKAVRETYGQSVVYTPGTGAPVTLRAVFDALYEVVQLLDGVPVTTQRPVLDVRLADLGTVAPAIGHTLVIGTDGYEVTDVQIDGRGSAKLFLVTL
jgi:hypothetical protein